MDAALLQSLGTFMAGLATLIGAIVGLWNRGKIAGFFLSRMQLTAERNIAIRQTQEALARAKVGEQTVADYESSITAIRARVEECEKKVEARNAELLTVQSELENVSGKFDALADWMHLMIVYAQTVRERAETFGADFGDLAMPIVPDILADRFGVPQALRQGVCPVNRDDV